MKIKIYPMALLLIATAYASQTHSQANQNLSNLLSPTAVNQDLLPYKHNSYDIGATGLNWRSLFLRGGIYFRDTLSVYAAGTGNFYSGVGAGKGTATGTLNTGAGFYSLASLTTGKDNSALGFKSLFATTTGYSNVAVGKEALATNTTGFTNTAIGRYTMRDNTSGAGNTAVGASALSSNLTGGSNAAVGNYTLNDNTSGTWNSGIGAYALYNNTTGDNNTAVGDFALNSNSTGHHNSAFGSGAGVSTGALSYATAIGANATVNASNKIQLGSSTTVLATAGGVTIVSDGRFKDNVREEVPGLAFINQLRTVSYNLNYKRFDDFLRKNETTSAGERGAKEDVAYQRLLVEKSAKREIGFIAQEVDKLCKEKKYAFNGVYTPQNADDNYALDYSLFVVPLVKSVQELTKKNEDAETRLQELEKQINELKQLLIAAKPGNAIGLSNASLEQNTPNPFPASTTIRYSLPQQFASAHIVIADRQGRLIKEFKLSGIGKGSLNVEAGILASGAYSYSLVIDGRVVSTKQMIAVK